MSDVLRDVERMSVTREVQKLKKMDAAFEERTDGERKWGSVAEAWLEEVKHITYARKSQK